MEILLNAALLVAIIAYLSDRKKEKLTYITEERQKWRERIRKDVPKLVKLTTGFPLKGMKLANDKGKREEATEIINYLLLSLNPNKGKDEVLKNKLLRLLTNQSIDRMKFVEEISKLLKEEWEKNKFEASNLKEKIFLLIGTLLLLGGYNLIFNNSYIILKGNVVSLGLIILSVLTLIILPLVLMVYLYKKELLLEKKERKLLTEYFIVCFFIIIFLSNIVFVYQIFDR